MKEIKINQKIGCLTILEKKKRNNQTMYLAVCECGNKKLVYRSNLIKCNYTKCSCLKTNTNGLKDYQQLYAVWFAMLRRCYNKTAHGYKWYGEKGIKVCQEWKDRQNGFLNFYNWSLQNGYKKEKMKSGRNKYTIDRIDNNKDYSPTNCRWVDYETQLTNLPTPITNKSGYIGVSWSKQEKKWICVISINNHSTRIGGFNSQREAVEARNNFIDKHKLLHKKNIYKGELSNGY